MTTSNARANQAWVEYAEQNAEVMPVFTQEAFEEGWETGYKTAREEIAKAIESADFRYNNIIQVDYAARIARGAES